MDFLPYIPHPEWLFVIAIFGLYFYESSTLLYSNEAVLIRCHRRWKVSFGSTSIQTFGRGLYIPSPLDISKPAYRIIWNTEGSVGPAPEWDIGRGKRSLQIVGTYAWFTISLLLVMSYAIVTEHTNLLATLLISFYTTTLLVFSLIATDRHQLGLTGRQIASLFFEVICCPPFAPNLARRLSLSHSPSGDGLELAARTLREPMWHTFVESVATTLQEVLDFHPEPRDTKRMETLLAFLKKEASECSHSKS